MNEPYIPLLVEGFLARTVPGQSEVTLTAHHLMGGADILIFAVIGSVGALLGYAVLYTLGGLLRSILHVVSNNAQQARTLRWQSRAIRILPLLLLAAALPYVGVITVIAAGFYRLKPYKAFLSLIMAELLVRLVTLYV